MSIDLQTDAEREIYALEMVALQGNPAAQELAEHAVIVHRKVIAERESTSLRSKMADEALFAIFADCREAAERDVSQLRPGASAREVRARQCEISAYIACSLRLIVGTTETARAMKFTNVGVRGADARIRKRMPTLAAKAIEHARTAPALWQHNKQQQRKGQAA